MNSFCDLNVHEVQSFPENLNNVKQMVKLGYTVVAINRFHVPVKESKNKRTSSESQVKSIKRLMVELMDELKKIACNDATFQLPKDFQLLSRITIPLNSQEELSHLRNNYFKELLPAFDLISVIPGDEKVFKSLMEGKIECDIISFQLENSFNFKLSRDLMGLGISKELVFEICYSDAIKSVSLRKYIFHNGKSLVQKTKHGKGIILSSGGEHMMDFRSPQDVSNFANLFDLRGAPCFDVVGKNCQKVVRHSVLRRKTFKGAVMVEKIDENEPSLKRQKLDIS